MVLGIAATLELHDSKEVLIAARNGTSNQAPPRLGHALLRAELLQALIFWIKFPVCRMSVSIVSHATVVHTTLPMFFLSQANGGPASKPDGHGEKRAGQRGSLAHRMDVEASRRSDPYQFDILPRLYLQFIFDRLVSLPHIEIG